MTNKEMLMKIREDRPLQKINKVISFEKNVYGFYDVNVDMEVVFSLFESSTTKIKHVHMKLPYPFSEYEKLSEILQLNYRLK
jgi:hypothetical protein